MTQAEADEKVREYTVAIVKQTGRGLIILVIIMLILFIAMAGCFYLTG